MDLPSLARDLDKLASADAIVADSYFRYALKKGALYFFASLLGLLGLLMLGLALYWLLSDSLGQIGAAALVGVLGCLVAAMVAVVAMLQRPGREFVVALEMRKSTIQTLEANVSAPPQNPGAFIYPASEVLVSSVLLPLLGALIRSLKSPHGTPSEGAPSVTKIADVSSDTRKP